MQMIYTHTAKSFENETTADMAKYYRSYINEYVTLNKWADSLGIPYDDAETMLAVCKACHEAGF